MPFILHMEGPYDCPMATGVYSTLDLAKAAYVEAVHRLVSPAIPPELREFEDVWLYAVTRFAGAYAPSITEFQVDAPALRYLVQVDLCSRRPASPARGNHPIS